MEKAAEERVEDYKSAEASAKAGAEVLRKKIQELRDRESRMAARADKAEKALGNASAMDSGVRGLSRHVLRSRLTVAQEGVDKEALEQSVSCEICQERMWQPWM